jgi:NADH-quinone oxidoreductase subunit G
MFLLDDVFGLMSEKIPEFAGLTLGKIGGAGIPLIETDERVPLLERERERIAKREIVG